MPNLKTGLVVGMFAGTCAIGSFLGATAALKREIVAEDLLAGAIASITTAATTFGAAVTLQKETVVERFVKPHEAPVPTIHSIVLVNAPDHAEALVDWAKNQNLVEVRND